MFNCLYNTVVIFYLVCSLSNLRARYKNMFCLVTFDLVTFDLVWFPVNVQEGFICENVKFKTEVKLLWGELNIN